MWLDDFRSFLCDLDGCLIAGDTVLAGARELLARAGERLWIVSNNSTDTPATLTARLERLGLPMRLDRIVLAGATAIEYLATRNPGARTAVYGSDAICDYARSLGLLADENAPEFVLLTRDPAFSYKKLNRIIRQIEDGAQLIVANLDATHPGPDGHAVAETGALLEAVRTCLPDLRYRPIGKPSKLIYQAVLQHVSTDPSALLAIGDNAKPDGEGARRLGIPCVLIGRCAGADFASLALLLESERLPPQAASGGFVLAPASAQNTAEPFLCPNP